VIALLFYISHRRWRPLLWLLVMLVLILAGTTALGGLIYGTLSVVSLGFASILLGLAEDFGIVLYQESRSHPDLTLTELRRAALPGIFWSTVTTSGAFLLLNLSGLPGLGQLGTLVAIGIGLSAVLMLYLYLPPLLRKRTAEAGRTTAPEANPARRASRLTPFGAWVLTGLLALLSVVLLAHRLPGFDNSPDALRPKHSPTYAAVEEIKKRMKRTQEPMWVLVTGRTESEVARRLDAAHLALSAAVSNQLIGSFALPVVLWPRPEAQAANRPAAAALVAQGAAFREATFAAGFTSNSFALTENILRTWQAAIAGGNVFWPTNATSEWILEKVFARNARSLLAIGLVYPPAQPAAGGAPQAGLNSSLGTRNSKLIALADELAPRDILLSGWEMLGYTVFARMKQDFWRVLLPMFALLAVSLWLAFRNAPDIFISLIALAFSGLCLWGVMSLAGWSWNLLNLMALPLLLGMGVDFSIHMQLALRRHHGELAVVSASVGRALLLAGATTVAGFASLILSSNAGMASLGKVCAAGISCAMFTSIFLLPTWWKTFHTPSRPAPAPPDAAEGGLATRTSQPRTPSSFYRAGVWRVGLLAARWLPSSLATALAKLILSAYALVAPHRRRVVEQNLLPIVNRDPAAARSMSWKLFRQFAVKLTDLLRYEAGRPVDRLFSELTGWEHFVAAQEQRRGVLLVTPHLGNWEFGGPLLTQRGYQLQVITLAEPGRGLTAMRQASRARWGIETLVMGEDPFAFVEVIRRLEAGATVALLIDRPPAASAVTVDLFGRPFDASIAAAELARASGCIVLPVFLPRTDRGYAAHILPEIAYHRPALRSRDARVDLTRQIMRAFEPAIRHHPDQWYHFVPIWPEA
jgi:lauroyl/myristoyl acyltransferase